MSGSSQVLRLANIDNYMVKLNKLQADKSKKEKQQRALKVSKSQNFMLGALDRTQSQQFTLSRDNKPSPVMTREKPEEKYSMQRTVTDTGFVPPSKRVSLTAENLQAASAL